MAESQTSILRCDSHVVMPCAKQHTGTDDSPAQLGDILSMLTHRPLEDVPKRTRWAVMHGKACAGATPDIIYDDLWSKIGNGQRHLSVALQGEANVLIFFERVDQGLVKQSSFSGSGVEIQNMYRICKSRGAELMRREIVDFCGVWFTQRDVTSNFELLVESHLSAYDAYKEVAALSDQAYFFFS